MKYTHQRLVLKGLLLSALASPAIADDHDWLNNIYATGHIGKASSDVSIQEVQAEFNDAGITNTTIHDVEDLRTGFGIGVGYEILPRLAVELAYLDLEQVDVEFTSTQAINNMEDIHPESGDGFTFSALYKHPLDDQVHARVRLGFFNWSADYDTTQGNGTTSGTDSDSGTDMYWGAGIGYQITESVTFIGEVQHFDFDRDNTMYLNIGAEWHY